MKHNLKNKITQSLDFNLKSTLLLKISYDMKRTMKEWKDMQRFSRFKLNKIHAWH